MSAIPPSYRARKTLSVAALLVGVVVGVGPANGGNRAADASASTTESTQLVEAAPHDKRVYLVGDSVALGARGYFADAFPPDWTAIVDGTPAYFVETLESRHVRPQMAFHPEWFGEHVVVAGGYNYPYWDPGRFDRSIDSMINTLTAAGVEHVYWVTLREVKPQYVNASGWRKIQPYYWYFPTVNAHLRSALDRHPNLTLIDWAAAADRSDITYDAIHLNPTGARLYSALVSQQITATTTRVAGGSTTEIPIANPDGVAAVAVNITSTSPRDTGFFTAFACGDSPPGVSSHNHIRDEIAAHSAIVPVGATGSICVYSEEAANMIVDVTGRFMSGHGFQAITPRRVHDSRATSGAPVPAGTITTVDVTAPGVPASAESVVLTVTAVDAPAAGYAIAYTCGETVPETSTVNYGAGPATPNIAVVAPSADGTVCVTASTDVHLLVDAFGAFGPGSDAVTTAPDRVLDTRGGQQLGAGQSITLQLDDAIANSGVFANLTATGAAGDGYLAAYPCLRGVPDSSSLNVSAGRDAANFVVIEPDGDGRLCVFSSVDTHVVVDVLGTTGAAFIGQTPTRLLDTRAS